MWILYLYNFVYCDNIKSRVGTGNGFRGVKLRRLLEGKKRKECFIFNLNIPISTLILSPTGMERGNEIDANCNISYGRDVVFAERV